METRSLGRSGLLASALGFGAGHLGRVAPEAVGPLLHGVLDLGITLIDTARGYGPSEALVGEHLAHRRDAFTLVTKVGYDVEGCTDWTRAAVKQGIDAALRRLRTDRIDVCLLHSCDLGTLQRGEVIEGLAEAVAAGKVRVPGYSGDNEALHWAVASGHFGVVETSVNVVDQWSLHAVLPTAVAQGVGVIAKRPIANVAWTFGERPVGAYAEDYWVRLQHMGVTPTSGDWLDAALRFTAFAPGVTTAIAGSSSLSHLQAMADVVARGPLEDAAAAQWSDAWRAHGQAWPGLV